MIEKEIEIMNKNDWFSTDEENNTELDYEVKIYDITSSPNDFNVKTYFEFIEAGMVIIPTFQRNYVWDIKRASKLIESLIIGLPIPQIFLFGEGKNKYLVIDGQQRLLSIYYFIKERFPRQDKRAEIRKKLIEKGGIIDDEFLNDDNYYRTFKLSLGGENPLNGKNYNDLGEYFHTFNFRTLRNISIQQNSPDTDNNSSMYEIFNRLNIGGMNLTPQEIRSSVYHSEFYSMLQKINLNPKWRELLRKKDLDLHLKDIEIILRGFALAHLDVNKEYKGNMKKLLNEFSSKARSYTSQQVLQFEKMFLDFTIACGKLDDASFVNINNKFQISIFDAVFYIWAKEYMKGNNITFDKNKFLNMRVDENFKVNTEKSTTNTATVIKRIEIAKEYLV